LVSRRTISGIKYECVKLSQIAKDGLSNFYFLIFKEILTSLKQILMNRINCTPPMARQNCRRQTKELQSSKYV
jgi:hypothetical protein